VRTWKAIVHCRPTQNPLYRRGVLSVIWVEISDRSLFKQDEDGIVATGQIDQ